MPETSVAQYTENSLATPADGTVLLGRHANGRLVPLPIDENGSVIVAQTGPLPLGSNPIGTVKVTLEPTWLTACVYDGSNNLIYLGRAQPGTSKATPLWQIQKLTWDGAGNCTDIQSANGSDQFTAIWNNYASYSYS